MMRSCAPGSSRCQETVCARPNPLAIGTLTVLPHRRSMALRCGTPARNPKTTETALRLLRRIMMGFNGFT